jgi:hypothetical protein
MLENAGDITKMDYKGETNMIKQLITQFRSDDYRPSAQALALTEWINELERLNDLFEEYDLASDKISKEKPKLTFTEARRETDAVLNTILDMVKGVIYLVGEGMVAEFIDDFNRHTNHYNTLVREHYGRTHVKIDISNAIVEPIPIQKYTGKHIIPIPQVSVKIADATGLLKVIELVFSEDFSVTYKSNIEPGTATILIEGVGKYTGQRTVLFNIENTLG